MIIDVIYTMRVLYPRELEAPQHYDSDGGEN